MMTFSLKEIMKYRKGGSFNNIGEFNMLREIITPKSQDYTLRIPAEYLNTKVEILVLPFVEKENVAGTSTTDIIKKTAGILASQSIDPLKWQKEIRDEWEDKT